MNITFTHLKLAVLGVAVWYAWPTIGPWVHTVLDRLPRPPSAGHAPSPRQPQGGPARGGLDYAVLLGNINAEWSAIFRETNRTYGRPRLVIYAGRTMGCRGQPADAQVGPFYAPECATIFLPAEFEREISQRTGCAVTNCQFAQAAVLAHEVGHHVESQFGMLQGGGGPSIELAADCLSGVWAKHEDDRLRKEGRPALVEPGDIEAALRFAGEIGSRSHGSGEQRQAAFNRGWRSGRLAACTSGGMRMAGVE